MPMRVAMISNTAWLDEELTTFQQLVVSLVAGGTQVVQVVPDRLALHEASGFGERLPWTDTSWPMLRSYRLGQLRQTLEEMGVDLVHALDGQVWAGALRLARRLNVPLALTTSARSDLALVEKLRSQFQQVPVAIAATTEPLGQALRTMLGAQVKVDLIPPGVHSFEEPPARPQVGEGVFCAAVCSSGVFDSDCQALFEALPAVIANYPNAQFFLDGHGQDQHPFWKAARQYGLLANLSMVPRRLGRRELLLKADMLIQPQPLGRSRSLTLQAMARGMPVLACADPWLDYLVDDQTAWLVERFQPERWQEVIQRAVAEPARARELGTRARQWVGPHHAVSTQAMQTLNFYRNLTGEAIRFPGRDTPVTG